MLSWSGTLRVCKRIKMDGMKWYHNFFNCSESQQKAEEVCPMYFMQLRSGLKIEKKTCYFRKETTKRHSLRTGKEKLHFLIIFQHNDGHLFAFTYHIKIHNFFPHPNSFWKRVRMMNYFLAIFRRAYRVFNSMGEMVML